MAVTRSTLPDALVIGVRNGHRDGQESVPNISGQIFDQTTSDHKSEFYSAATSFGFQSDHQELEQVNMEVPIQDGSKTILNVTKALGYEISIEMVADSAFNDILRNATNLGKSSAETKEMEHLRFLSNAFTTSLSQDNVAIISNHTLPGGGTYSNLGAVAALSTTTLEALDIISGKTLRRAGIPMANKAQLLVVPTSLSPLAEKLIKSTLDPLTANNAINVFSSKGSRLRKGFVESPYLTSDTAYFLRNESYGMISQNRLSLQLMDDVQTTKIGHEFVSYQRYGIGCTDWRSVSGSVGA